MASTPIELHIRKCWTKPVVRALEGNEADVAIRLILAANQQSKRTGK
jgi:hypothetical protein